MRGPGRGRLAPPAAAAEPGQPRPEALCCVLLFSRRSSVLQDGSAPWPRGQGRWEAARESPHGQRNRGAQRAGAAPAAAAGPELLLGVRLLLAF